MSNDQIVQVLSIVLTSSLGAITTLICVIVSYRLGKRSKIDEETIKRKFQYADELTILLQAVIELDTYYYNFYMENYENTERIEDAVENFERMHHLFRHEYERIALLMTNRMELKKNFQ